MPVYRQLVAASSCSCQCMYTPTRSALQVPSTSTSILYSARRKQEHKHQRLLDPFDELYDRRMLQSARTMLANNEGIGYSHFPTFFVTGVQVEGVHADYPYPLKLPGHRGYRGGLSAPMDACGPPLWAPAGLRQSANAPPCCAHPLPVWAIRNAARPRPRLASKR